MRRVSLVFHGTVLERKTLPQRSEMMGRRRYAIAFRVNEYWKGSPSPTAILYGLDSSTDCLGDGGYEVGKNYLVYAAEREVLGNGFRYYWTDVLPEGTRILAPAPCMPGGETAADRRGLDHELGKGRIPQKTE